MKTFSRILTATALVSVAACGKLPGASLGGTFGVERFLGLGIPSEGLDFPAQTYSAALAREYQNLANDQATRVVNWIDASAYMNKGLAALRGESIQPWEPSALGLSGEIEGVYATVIETINNNAGRNPVACARALALYDNYAETLSEGDHTCNDGAAIYAELQDALEACGYQKAYQAPPPPQPVGDACSYADVPAGCTCAPYEGNQVAISCPAPAPEPVVEYAPAPVPYDACASADVPDGCTCATYNDQPVVSCPAPAPVEYTPAPAPNYGLNYTVYFGYDRCDLTAEAGAVINEALTAFRAYAAPFMDIVGHTDTHGSKAYNTRLAECRANAVASSMASQGVDYGQMRVSARSELDPAMATGDGVREALNRRVSITIVQ